MYHFTDGGLQNVWLENGYAEKDTPYGITVSFQDLAGLTKAICLALVQKPGKLSGAELRYLRGDLELSQHALGKLLGCTEQAIALWEKHDKIPKAEDYLVRRIYLEANNRQELMGNAVDVLDAIDGTIHLKITLVKTQKKWTAKTARLDDEAISA